MLPILLSQRNSHSLSGVYEKTQEGILHVATIGKSFAMKYSFLFGEINDASLLFVIIFYTISVAFL